MSLPIFTIQTFNQNSLQPTGAVFAQRVEAITMSRNFLAGITGTAGGRNTAMEKKMNELTKALTEELQLQAKNTYPSAVALVDVKMQFSNIGKDDSNMLLAGQASATALIKRVKSVGSSVTSSNPVNPMPPMAPVAPVAPVASRPISPPMGSPVASRPINSSMADMPPMNSGLRNYNIPQRVGGKRKSKLGKSRKNRSIELSE
jgi:uncharacterized protein YbjQ (UPF0145 family)